MGLFDGLREPRFPYDYAICIQVTRNGRMVWIVVTGEEDGE